MATAPIVVIDVDPVTLPELTEASLTGKGVFDVLMKASREHLELEYGKDRIKGTEYAQVYLGQLQSVLGQSVEFLLQRQNAYLGALLLRQQIIIAENQVLKTEAEIEHIRAQTKLLGQDYLNAITEGANLVKAGCKLDAEYDVLMSTNLKVINETGLLAQKVVTEKAQTTGMGVDADSVIGKQKNLYQAQTDGFKRDAELNVAKMMADTWSVRRSTDEATIADEVNKLSDSNIGRVVQTMMTGIGA